MEVVNIHPLWFTYTNSSGDFSHSYQELNKPFIQHPRPHWLIEDKWTSINNNRKNGLKQCLFYLYCHSNNSLPTVKSYHLSGSTLKSSSILHEIDVLLVVSRSTPKFSRKPFFCIEHRRWGPNKMLLRGSGSDGQSGIGCCSFASGRGSSL